MIEAEEVFNESFTARNFNSSPLTISGLEGDTYDYELVMFNGIPSANSRWRVRFNGDSTSNYRFYGMRAAGALTGASTNDAVTEIRISSSNQLNTGNTGFVMSSITGSSGDERYVDTFSSGHANINKESDYWKNTANELISMEIATSTSITLDAHIMLYRTPKISEQSNWELMKTLDWSSETAEKSFSSLLGDTDKEYRISWEGDQELNIEINNDNASNYTRQYLQNSGGSLSANNASNTSIVTDGIESTVIINAETGVERLCLVNSSNTTAAQQSERDIWYSNTATEITSLDCTPTASATGTAKLYRRIEPSGTGDTLPLEVMNNIPLSSDDFSAGQTINMLGDSMNLLKIEGLLSNASGDIEIRMELESDTAANYPEQFLKGDTSTASAAAATRNYIVLAKLQNGDQSEFTTYLYPRSGANRPLLTQCSYDENAVEFLGQWWNNSADEITTAKIYASTSNAVTGNIKVSRLAGTPPSYLSNPLHFDGTNDLITMPDNSVFEFGSSDFSIAMQFTFRAEPFSYVFNRVESGSIYTQMYVQSSGLGIRMVLSSGGGTFFTLVLPSTITTGNTYSLIIRRSGNDLNAYIDGVAGPTYDMTGISMDAVSSVTEVGASTFDSRWDDFDVANWTVYNEAITTDDIAELQTLRQLEDYSPTLQAKFACALPLNDEAADPFDDISGNSLDATAVGGAALSGGTAMKFFN